MFKPILTHSPATVSFTASTIREYALTVTNPSDGDTQELTAAFSSIPSAEDWKNWLSG